MTCETMDLRSPGQLATDLAAPYSAIIRVVRRLELRPAMTLNGLPYFDADQQERITTALRQRQEGRQDG